MPAAPTARTVCLSTVRAAWLTALNSAHGAAANGAGSTGTDAGKAGAATATTGDTDRHTKTGARISLTKPRSGTATRRPVAVKSPDVCLPPSQFTEQVLKATRDAASPPRSGALSHKTAHVG